MRNETAGALFLVLLMAVDEAEAQPGAWFGANPCTAESGQWLGRAGEPADLSVHDEPGAPPHDARLIYGADGVWRVPLSEWQRWTPRPPATIEAGEDLERLVPLLNGPGLVFRFDACTSELWVDANPDRIQQTQFDRPQSLGTSTAGRGGFLNLDATYGGLAGRNVVSSLFDAGVFLPGGAGRSGFFAGSGRFRRLDSRWLVDQPDRAMRLSLGDSITRSADWESAVRFGGVQWGRDFSLQPDRITFPLPAIAGSAALASTAELYVNGQQQAQQSLQAGNFRFESVPTLTGAGELSVVIRDSLGREQTVTQPFYASPRLLAAGLDANTYEAGFLREDYASSRDRYTRPFAATTLQHGFTDRLSGLLRASASQQRQLAGAEADWIVAPFGVVTISAAGTHTEAGWGGVGTIAFERTADRLSLTVRRRFATRAYGDLGREPGTLHFSDAARIALNLRRAGTASALYVSEQPWQGSGVRLTGLAYSLPLGSRVQAYASWLHPLAGVSGDSIVVGFTAALGRGTSAGAQWTGDSKSGGPSFGIQHVPDGRLGWSYAAAADARNNGVRQAEAAWATGRGTVGAGWAGFGDEGAPLAFMQTGLAMLDGHVYWTRPVQNSFAVVDTAGTGGVRVLRENQWVGTTDASGRLLVPDLLPFQANRLAIDDRDLPIGLGLTRTGELVAPPANAGVSVRFSVDAHPARQLRLVDSVGVPVPVGAMLSLDGKRLPLPVGYDGLVYADISEGGHVLTADWHEGRCETTVEVAGADVQAAACRSIAQ